MARHASTYRQARRAVWKLTDLTWPEANAEMKGNQHRHSEGKRFGPVRADYAGGAHFLGGRSKYMPHVGAKQRAKGAARAA